MNVTFRQLELFRALVATGSISSAARQVGVTQPTASIHLKELTEEVGVPLHEVIGRKVYLTEAGRMLAKTAEGVRGEWEAFEQGVKALSGAQAGRLRVALVSTAQYFLPRMLGTFCATRPDVEASMEVLNRDGVVERMRTNLDDLYVMSRPPEGMSLTCTPFMSNPLVLIAPSSRRFVGRDVSLRDLAAERFIARERGSGTRLATDAFFKSRRFAPKVRFELGSNEAIIEAVAGGMGVAVVSAHAVGKASRKAIRVIQAEGFPIASSWQIVFPAGRRMSPLASAFQAHLIKEGAVGPGQIAGV